MTDEEATTDFGELEELGLVDEENLFDSVASAFSEEMRTFSETREGSENLKALIASSFINRQLESFLLKYGSLPESPAESCIGVGFVDIVDYSYLSKWLSPRENQRLLNGLYTAFNLVLKKRGGYLNKISGDSLMFHFGGMIDPLVSDLDPREASPLIARYLFLTCIEIQESCRLFNRADEDFIPADVDAKTRSDLVQAFLIIRNLRENLAQVSTVSHLFQVRIRIGASIGDVCVGIFGPEGAKQWDVIGIPVIEARRMESSAPLDGIRVSERLIGILKGTGIVEQYHRYFKSRASGFYQAIHMDELFKPQDVILFDKKNEVFNSCVIQANPDLPEDVWRQAEACLEKGEAGVDGVLEILKYYRGNRYVVEAIEELMREREIRLRKAAMFKFLLPNKYAKLVARNGGNEILVEDMLEKQATLYQLFCILGQIQDKAKHGQGADDAGNTFHNWEEWIGERYIAMRSAFLSKRATNERYLYFTEVLFPGFFAMIKASIMENLSKAC